jgi:hypothetical protein
MEISERLREAERATCGTYLLKCEYASRPFSFLYKLCKLMKLSNSTANENTTSRALLQVPKPNTRSGAFPMQCQESFANISGFQNSDI